MARKQLPDFYNLGRTIFRKNDPKAKGGRQPLELAKNGKTSRERIEAAFVEYVLKRFMRAGISTKKSMAEAASILKGEQMHEPAAWAWVLSEFLRECPDYMAPEYQDALTDAHARVQYVTGKVRTKIERSRIQNASSQRRAQYESERAANGGDKAFFDSQKWRRLRYQVLLEADGKCCLCGRSAREHAIALEVDHIKPRSRFPNLALVKSNLQALCFDCNRGKMNHDTRDWRVIEGGRSTTG